MKIEAQDFGEVGWQQTQVTKDFSITSQFFYKLNLPILEMSEYSRGVKQAFN